MADDKGKNSGDEGDGLWQKEVADVTPLAERDDLIGSPKRPRKKVPERVSRDLSEDMVEARANKLSSGGGLDRQTTRRSKQGKRAIEGRIDLHGLRGIQARTELTAYLKKCHREGRRQILVITGKGGRHRQAHDEADNDWWEGRPVLLREAVPLWLDEPPLASIILSHNSAQPKDGGSGARYVLLRRRRE